MLDSEGVSKRNAVKRGSVLPLGGGFIFLLYVHCSYYGNDPFVDLFNWVGSTTNEQGSGLSRWSRDDLPE